MPENFDARTQWPMCPFEVLNQQHCGSCVSNLNSDLIFDFLQEFRLLIERR
jgi:hypothetical protein